MKHSTITNLSLGGLFLSLAVGTAWALTMLPPEFHQGPDPQGRAGYAVAVAEVTGDGVADLIVGAPAYDAGAPPGDGQNTDSPEPSGPAGRVLVYAGSVGPGDAPSTILHGEAPNDRFGTAIKVANVVGDGSLDLIVSAMFASGHESYRSGCVYIFEGPIVAPEIAAHDATVEACGTQYREHFGRAIEVGDFDGDGRQDVVVGSPWYTAGHGHVEEGMHPEDGQMTGAVSLISGAAIAEHLAAPPTVPEHELMVELTPGEGYLAFYGISLLNLGNLDNPTGLPLPEDQQDDLMIWASGAGAGGHTRPGSAYFASWSEAPLPDGDPVGFGDPRVVITGDGTTSLGEGTPALIGDLNGDTWPEITMPGRSGPNNAFLQVDTITAGGLYIVDGNLLNPAKFMPFVHGDTTSINKLTVVSLAAISGEKLQDKFGTSAVDLGDLNNPPDGVPDFAVGAPWADGILLGSTISGRVYAVSGAEVLQPTPGATTSTGLPTSLAWKIETHGDHILLKDAGGNWVQLAGRGNDRMGQALAAGDLTASTLPDLVVGAPDRDPTAVDTVDDVPGTNSNENSGAAVIQSFQP